MDYLEQYKKLHSQGKYGVSSEKLVGEILPLVQEIKPKTILDFGCGQSKLVDMLPCKRRFRYDPAVEKYNSTVGIYGAGIDLVLCIDVLEHIPEDEIHGTLVNIMLFSDKVIFDIGTQPATHILPNGENAHCTVYPIAWWLIQLRKVFLKVTFVKDIRGVKFLCKTW